jgi:signal transduction histidine kinase
MKMIVHDLKTPLTSVLATLEMAADGDFGPVTPGTRQALVDAEEKAQDLLILIERPLEIARIEGSARALECSRIEPAASATSARDWQIRFQQAGVRHAIDPPTRRVHGRPALSSGVRQPAAERITHRRARQPCA